MTVDHDDLARQAFDASALPSHAAHAWKTHCVHHEAAGMLPAGEQAGYVKGPAGGENVTALPDGTLVRISRVMYPDGQIYKVMSDAPNGQPQWHAEDVRPELYVPFGGPHVPVPDPHRRRRRRVDLGPLLGPDRRSRAGHGATARRVRGSQPADRGVEQTACGSEHEAGAGVAAVTGLHRARRTVDHHLEAADMIPAT